MDQKSFELAKHEAMIAFLMAAPGLGLVVAAMFVSVVDAEVGSGSPGELAH